MGVVTNVMLCGVGGQGTILASRVLSQALVDAGLDVKMSEIHGISQRGGSVVTQIRYGDAVASPIIGRGRADAAAAFEAMEAVRYLWGLKPDGHLIANDFRIPTAATLSGTRQYPDDILGCVPDGVKLTKIDAAAIASSIGDPRCMNSVILGALIDVLGIGSLDWEAAVAACVAPASVDVNCRALEAGMRSADLQRR